jgi:peroxidase
MSGKPILCLLIACFSISIAIAQKERAAKGKLFLLEARPRNSNEPLRPSPGNTHPLFRTYDGKYNNLERGRTDWGSADILLYRELPAAYSSAQANGMAGVNRPSARKISNVVIDEPVTQFNTLHLSTLVYQWGQFLDHDMSLTPTDTIEYVPILLPDDEIIFTEDIPFFRSEFRMTSGNRSSVRQQINLNTSFIDGSVVYGSDSKRANWLRTFRNGKLKTSSGNLMPYNTIDGELGSKIDPNAPSMANDNGGTVKTFAAGDVRASENPVLISIHTLFVREHNRICDRLMAQGLRNDELIYQMARKEVGALIEAITYQEFLPALGITLQSYPGYRNSTRPDIMNTFATASYRLGHTMVSDDVVLADNDCEEAGPGEMELTDVFWAPDLVALYGVDVFIKGASSHDQYETDTKINSVLRNLLFVSPNDPVRFGIDLGSLNIQRGRDHGLPDYNTTRLFYTGRAARRFSDITSNDSLATALQNLYGNINNVDLWIGMLAEDHLPGKSVGRTLHAMLKSQFEKLRDGDYYFYLNDPYLPDNIRNQVRNTKFSQIIKRNSGLTNIAVNAFRTDSCHEEEETKIVSNSLRQTLPVVKEVSQFKVYPNPASDILNIELNNTGAATIKIFSATGELVKTIVNGKKESHIQINVSNLTKGVYAINIITNREVKSITFVKM